MNILFGTYAADAGSIEVEGRPVAIRNSADALNFGIGMVHQHFELVPRHTVLENLLVGKAGPTAACRARPRSSAEEDRQRLPSRSRSRPARRRPLRRRAAARRDREVARARRAHPRPRRADCNADAARIRRPLPGASLDGGERHGRYLHLPQARRGDRDHQPHHRDAARPRRRRAWERRKAVEAAARARDVRPRPRAAGEAARQHRRVRSRSTWSRRRATAGSRSTMFRSCSVPARSSASPAFRATASASSPTSSPAC